MSKINIFCLIFLICYNIVTYAKNEWTEEDEARRIAQIKEEEKRLFKLEISRQKGYVPEMYDDRFLGSNEDHPSLPYPSRLNDGRTENYRLASQNLKNSKDDRISKHNPVPYQNVAITHNKTKTNWCFYCASPWRVLTSDLKRAIENLLNVRRTQYPYDAIVEKCTNPENINALPKQQCLHSYCQTLVLTDHQTGTAFTMRGCAENFAAINPRLLESRPDNNCERLHPHLDLQECLCKKRKYCYKGSVRTNLHIEDDTEIRPYVSRTYARSVASSGFISYAGILICAFILPFLL